MKEKVIQKQRTSAECLALLHELLPQTDLHFSLERTYLDVREQFGRCSYALNTLLDQSNWRTARPEICVYARVNQAHNLVVKWHPNPGLMNYSNTNPLQFEPGLLNRCDLSAGPTRPLNELIWIRKAFGSQAFVNRPDQAKLVLAIYQGIIANYDELIAMLAEHFLVSAHSRLALRLNKSQDYLRLTCTD